MQGPKIKNEKAQKALTELKANLTLRYPKLRLVLFGSMARREQDEESDVDILVLTEQPLTWKERDAPLDEVFSVNLHYDTNISVLIVDRRNWKEGPIPVMPIRAEIEREGIEL